MSGLAANEAVPPAEVTAEWIAICALDDIPRLGARVYPAAHGNIALFRTADDRVFALRDRCPHKGGPLSQGLVCGHAVSCPLHAWTIALDSGLAQAPDQGEVARFDVRVADGRVLLAAPITVAALAQRDSD